MMVLTPQIGRWTTPDDYAEITVDESPYCYVDNRPVSRIDPDGNTGWDVIAGIGTALVDNAFGTNTAASYPATNNSDFNKGNKIGQAASVLIGATETAVGDAMMGGGGASLALSGGSTAPVSVPMALGGAALAGHGITMTAKGYANLMTGKGQKAENTTTTESSTFNGKQDTQSQTKKEAFNKAKEQNGIPTSQQPDKTIKVKENGTNKNLREYQYTNSKGEKSIRKDNPKKYSESGKGDQGNHYNAGKTQQKLKQHHNYGSN